METIREIMDFVTIKGLFSLVNLVLFLAALVAFVRGLRKKEEKEGNMNRMPNFGGHTYSGEKKTEGYEDEQVGRKGTYGSDRYSASVPAPFIVSNTVCHIDDREDARESSASRSGASRQGPRRLDDRLGADEAMNGVVWAEILGPPRAKRPFGRRPF